MNRLTESGARIMATHLTKSFVVNTPAHEAPTAWVQRALLLQQQLGRILGVTPSAADIEELVTTFEELDSVEAGTHPDLARNTAFTVDNTAALTEHLMNRLNQETTDLLEHAHFGQVAVA